MKRARITAKPPRVHKLTDAQRLLMEQLRPVALARGMTIEAEKVFAPPRKWRIDVALLEPAGCVGLGFAIEINGAAWSGGRHTRGGGYIKDMEKLNALTKHGWRILQFTPQQVKSGEALTEIRACL